LHFFGAAVLYIHFRHIYSHRIALWIIGVFSLIKEVYDYLYGTGFSSRDILMNILGVLLGLLILRIYQRYFKSLGKFA